MFWRCDTCRASGISDRRTIEEDEVDHFLEAGCRGRCVAERLPSPPMKAYAMCAKCKHIVEGREHSRSWNGYVCFVFECHGARSEVTAERNELLFYSRRGTVAFDRCFSAELPVLLHFDC
jgi:uncharacterized protein YlaI